MSAPNQRLSIDTLRTLRTVVDTGSATTAADRLNLSQSAVSWKIKRLEAQLGRTLLRRDGRRLVATADGEALLAHARRILDAHDDALAYFAPSRLKGRVRLGVPEQVGLDRIAPLLAEFSRRHPRTTVQLSVMQSPALRDALAQDTLDLAVHQDYLDRITCADTPLWRESLHWCTSAATPLAVAKSIPLVTFGTGCHYGWLAQATLREAGMDHRIVAETPSLAGIQSAIGSGLGFGILNDRAISNDVMTAAELERRFPLPDVVHALRYGKRARDAALRALHEALQGVLGSIAA